MRSSRTCGLVSCNLVFNIFSTRGAESADPHHFDGDPDPTLHLMRIRSRILLLIKVMRICDHWSTDHPRPYLSLHASVVGVQGPPWHH
jgi:hypothetical protein